MAESSLLYPESESRNNGLRSPEETHRTINHLLAELVKLQERFNKVNEVNANLVGSVSYLAECVASLEAEVKQLREGD